MSVFFIFVSVLSPPPLRSPSPSCSPHALQQDPPRILPARAPHLPRTAARRPAHDERFPRSFRVIWTAAFRSGASSSARSCLLVFASVCACPAAANALARASTSPMLCGRPLRYLHRVWRLPGVRQTRGTYHSVQAASGRAQGDGGGALSCMHPTLPRIVIHSPFSCATLGRRLPRPS